jgi:CheY-like chemotaxis protein
MTSYQNRRPAFFEENIMREVSPNRVLLVDDDPSVRNLLSRQLERAGFETRQAEDGIDGLGQLRMELPQVIISDLQMPSMAGMEFVSVVRQRFPFIPVIVLSRSVPNEFPAEAQPDAWFEKGALNINELLRTLRGLIRKAPQHADFRQAMTAPVQTSPVFAGSVSLTCPDCLRTFWAMNIPENKTVERAAVCTHCQAHVPFLIESLAPRTRLLAPGPQPADKVS